MPEIPIAVQMYSLREESLKDFSGTLKKVADLGFSGVEFAGYGGLQPKEVRALLDDYGLRAASSHISLADMENDLDRVIEAQKILGSDYIVCPFIEPGRRSEADYKSLVHFLNITGEKCRTEGLTLCYHNHDFELNVLSDGRTVLDTIFDDTEPEFLKTELDVYWLAKAEEDPVEWLTRYKGRSPLVHLKDMTNDEERFFAELGTGGVNIDAILDAGDGAGVQWWIVEQDFSRRTPFESVAISMNYLQSKLGEKKGGSDK